VLWACRLFLRALYTLDYTKHIPKAHDMRVLF